MIIALLTSKYYISHRHIVHTERIEIMMYVQQQVHHRTSHRDIVAVVAARYVTTRVPYCGTHSARQSPFCHSFFHIKPVSCQTYYYYRTTFLLFVWPATTLGRIELFMRMYKQYTAHTYLFIYNIILVYACIYTYCILLHCGLFLISTDTTVADRSPPRTDSTYITYILNELYDIKTVKCRVLSIYRRCLVLCLRRGRRGYAEMSI